MIGVSRKPKLNPGRTFSVRFPGGLTAVCCVLACLIGCDGEPTLWEVSFAPYEYGCPPIRILEKGVVVAEYALQAPGAPPESQTVHGRLFIRETLDDGAIAVVLNKDFRFEQLTPTGWREFLEPSHRTGGVTWERIDDRVTFQAPYPEQYVVIDNRRHGAVRVAFGELELPVEANTVRVFRFDFSQDVFSGYAEPSPDLPAEERPNSWEVKLDDELIGTMERGTRCLIDISGSRTYRLQEILYSITFDPFGEDNRFSATYTGALFHPLPAQLDKIDFLFTPAAAEVETFGYADQTRWQLTEIEE